MLFQSVMSVITTFVFMGLWISCSGGTLQNFSFLLYLFMLACGVPFLFTKKNFSSFKLLFSRKKTLLSCSLEQYKNLDEFISFMIKLQLFFALIFTGIASMNFFSNLDNLSYLGPNLATVLEAPLFALLMSVIILPLKTRTKILAISTMQDEENNVEKTPTIKVITNSVKAILIIIWIILTFVLLKFFTKGNIALPTFFDVPSLLLVILFFTSFLLISGSTKIFIKAICFALLNKKESVGEKAKYMQTISGLIKSQLCVGGASFFIASMAMLSNLEDYSYLGTNYCVAILGFIYSIFVSIILLVLNSVIYNKE